MISRKSFKNSPGMILVDAMLAVSFAAIFILIITQSSASARDLYYRAHERQEAINSYIDMSSTSIRTRMFGNDRIETDTSVNATDSIGPSLLFSKVSMNSDTNSTDAAGTPLCSVDLLHGHAQINALITPIRLPINQASPLTDLQVRDGIAYVSVDSSVSADPDLYVFDIHDSQNPHVVSSINTGPGISAFTLAGRYIFAAARSTAAQLHIIRLDSLASLFLENKFKLSLPYATATAPLADSIFYDDGRIYLGTDKWDGAEFNVIDVSNPAGPAWLGGFETGTKVNAMYVRNGLAYIADADQNQLRVADVSDPADSALINAFSPSGWQRQEGQALDLFEDGLAFGRTSGGFDIQTDPEAFAWSSTSVSTLVDPQMLNDPGGIYGIVTDRSHLFFGTRQSGKELKIFDRNLSAIFSTTYPLPAGVQSMTCDGDSIYVLGHSAPLIYKIDFN